MQRAVLVILTAIVTTGCKSDAPPAPAAVANAPEFQMTADMKQLMNWILDPHADVVWAAVGTTISETGTEEHAPVTDEQWTTIRNSAAIIAESGNLLLLPQRARDQGDWVKHAHALTKAAREALDAAEAKDAAALFTAGSDVYLACSACHAQYMIAQPPQ